MMMRFRNRTEAGQHLAKRLKAYASRSDVLVLALPRGGVSVGYEVAQALNAPLDVFVVRKLGVPGHEELAMGAIASGGVRWLNGNGIDSLGISAGTIDAVAAQELQELERRERAYRGDRPAPDVQGRTVILVDDGIVVATPTAALSTVREMRPTVDELVTVMTPADFESVGRWYLDFPQTTDEEVCEMLDRASQLPNPTP
jgi:putative phosphoribosyl transferase